MNCSLRKQPTFGDATTGFPHKWHLRNERRNSILMTRHYPDLGGDSDWSRRVGNLFQPIRSTTQIWVVTRHRYGIPAIVSQTSFVGETSNSQARCRIAASNLCFGNERILREIQFHGLAPVAEENDLILCCVLEFWKKNVRSTPALLGSLSNSVFERRTSAGSGLFASLGSGLVETLG